MNIDAVYRMMLAIAYFEGAFQENSRAWRNRNPGNLRGWSPRTPKDSGGFDIFPTWQDGWNALWAQIWRNIMRNLTLRQFFEGKAGVYPGYAPLSDGNPATYSRFVSEISGIPIDGTTIIEYITL